MQHNANYVSLAWREKQGKINIAKRKGNAMKKALVWILVLALLSVASILGTIAYLTDEATADNVMTVGKVDIELLEYQRVDTEYKDADKIVEEFVDGKPLLPAVVEKGFSYDFSESDTAHVKWDHDEEGNAIKSGYTSPIWDPTKISNEVDKMVFVRNNGDYNAYVRVFFAFEAGNYVNFEDFQNKIHLNLNDDEKQWIWEWDPRLGEINGETYFIATATYQTELEPKTVTEISLSQIALDSSATNEEVDAFGNDYKVLVRTQAIQSTGFEVPETALDEGFGVKPPFEGMALAEGIALKTALHNLNGNSAVPITSKVASVTFGLNKTYPQIVKNNIGTLTSVAQDTAVYTYYVKNADNNYDIYVLADSAIYTPKDSTGLFQNMTSLTTVNTLNMNVSRTINASNMFRGCTQLTSVDVSKWDVSNVTNMYCMFGSCQQLQTINVSEWNTAKVTDMGYLFYDCQKLTSLDVSGWQVGKVISMQGMFYGSKSLTTLDVSKWNTSNVTDMSAMFLRCLSLKSLDVGNWDVSKVTTFNSFLSGFVIGDTSAMAIESINVDNWTTTSLTNMYQMFCFCPKLKTLNVKNWDVSKVTTMYAAFDNIGVTVLDISTWNTANLTDMAYMFAGSENLKTIYVGDGWSVAAATNAHEVFTGCINLKGGAGTTYKDTNPTNKTYARIDDPENGNPGYLTHISAKAAESEQNQ